MKSGIFWLTTTAWVLAMYWRRRRVRAPPRHIDPPADTDTAPVDPFAQRVAMMDTAQLDPWWVTSPDVPRDIDLGVYTIFEHEELL